MKFKFLKYLMVLFLAINTSFALDSFPRDIVQGSENIYYIRLEHGDVLTGYIKEFFNDPDDGEGIKFVTEVGTAPIFAFQILEIKSKNEIYRHGHRVYLLPTAEPIGDNHFIGSWEIGLIYAGGGIGDIFSLTAGRTMVPGLYEGQQGSIINGKFTVLKQTFESDPTVLFLGVGTNLAWINDANGIYHGYMNATLKGDRSSLTLAVLYKYGEKDIYDFRLSNNQLAAPYANGSFGIALGLDTKFSSRHDLRFIGELWNGDITRPSNTGVLLGFRLANTSVSMDFGLAFFTAPFAAPFVSFAWTPF